MKNLTIYWKMMLSSWSLLVLLILLGCAPKSKVNTTETEDSIVINTENYTVEIQKEGFRYKFIRQNGKIIADAHSISGIQLGESDSSVSEVHSTELINQSEDTISFLITTKGGIEADVTLNFLQHAVKMQVQPKEEGNYNINVRTGGVYPAFGLGDHAAFGSSGVRGSDEVTGIELDPMSEEQGTHRMISNFVIFPKQGFAEVNIEATDKIVRLTREENVQGSMNVKSMPAIYYFMGTPKQIYQSFLDARNKEGFPVYKPKYEWFGVGWEAWGALAWNTSKETVTKNINEYFDHGYPLKWMVIGSGFWPRGQDEMDKHGTPYQDKVVSEDAKKLLATTSFGMWDKHLYPNPKEMIDSFHELGLKVIIGLRNGFIPGGPFTDEGLEQNYFMENKSGQPKLFRVGFPRSEVYLLDAENPKAVDWYAQLFQKWGVDGYKEDLFGYPKTISDDFVNPINEALMDKGVYVMGRNNYLGSAVDIHRFEDFNYNQSQDRGPINGLAYAYSGFPYVYPDVVGGTGITTGRFGDEPITKLKVYLMRYAQYAALNPSMSYGYSPWNFDDQVDEVALQAAQLHNRLQPYIYSNAIKTYQAGFPYTMTPLPLAYPDDPNVYGLADTTRRSYQWMIGESLLATPLYGDDYATASSRDVYLPKGTWIEYDSGMMHQGPATLEDYLLPVGKTPLFVGGCGIVVEEIDGKLMCRVYPLADKAEMLFYAKDGETQSRISVKNPNWEAPSVTDLNSGKRVQGSWNRHAYEFLLTPGNDYMVK